MQAWFKLVEKYDLHTVVGEKGSRLERLKKDLAKVVACFEFGAVMEEDAFWEVVRKVMGLEVGREVSGGFGVNL